MLILGIETATEQVSVALGGHEGVIALFEVARGRRHAEILTPAIEFVCAQADIGLDEIGLVAVDVGPGLFTGMRVGLAAGKALAQALRVPMIGISSLDLLAFPHRRSDRVVVPVIDARKGEVFYAMYRQVPGGLQQVGRAAGRARRRARRRPAGPQPGGPVRRRRGAALPRPDPRRLPLRARRRRPSVRRPARPARPRPGPARGVGVAVRTSVRCTCASPTPRSTGRAGPARRLAGRPAGGGARRERAGSLPRPARCRAAVDRADAPPPRRPGHRHRAGLVPEAWSVRVFHDELDQARDGHRTYLVARRGRTVVGYGGLMYVVGEAHVTNIAVHPDHRRHGIATRLLAELARAAIDRGCQAWTLEVRASSTRGPGAVPLVRVRAGRDPRPVLRGHRGRHRDVVPRHPDGRLRPSPRGAATDDR